MSVEVKGFLKIVERGSFVRRKSGEKGQLEELGGDQNPSPEAPPR